MNGWYPDVDAMIESAPGIYEFTYGLLDPYYRYEFKITDGTWDLAIPDANSWCYADESGAVTITYDANEYADGWAPSWDRIGLSVDPGSWTAVGDWQGWDPTNGDTQMSPIGGGIHTHTESGLTGGMHYWKAVVTGTWDAISWNARSVNAADMGFLITSPYDVATFQVDALAGTVRVDVSRDCNNNGTEDGDELAGCDGSPWCSDCNANGILDECDLLYGTSTDVDGNGVPDECELCPCGDVDRSGGPVDLNDFARFALCYGFSSPGGDCTGPDFACSDIDADGTVSLSDFATFAVWYGLVSSQTVPECNIR
jgi:hypothetical protein